MIRPRTHYSGRDVTFATMHGKELLARDPFERLLGATVTAPPHLDTDQFGTFAGDIPRTLAPRDAARAKARLGMQIAGNPLGLASEGTFATGLGPGVENTELLLFLDDDLGFELLEGIVGVSALPAPRRIQSAPDAMAFAVAVGFPRQGVILQTAPDEKPPSVWKDITHLDQLRETSERLLGRHASIVISPDYRSHQAPTRARTIRTLSEQMAQRLATRCPLCQTPGYGRVDFERGVPARCADH